MRFSPALGTWYELARLNLPGFAQPKLDGLRAVYMDGHFFSRPGNHTLVVTIKGYSNL